MKQGRNEGGSKERRGKEEQGGKDGRWKEKRLEWGSVKTCCRSRSISHFLHVAHLRIWLLIYPNPNAMGGRRCALPPNPPPAFLSIIVFSHTSIQLPLSFCICPSPLQPFFHTHLCNYISLLSAMFCLILFIYLYTPRLRISLSNLSKRHGGEALRPPPQPPSSFFKHHVFSHMSIQLPLSFCICPSPPRPFFHTPYMQLNLSSFCPSIPLTCFV